MIAKNKDFPARVRFLLQDVIDSRKNNWKPRREKAGPKTIDQIHKEAESEKLNQQVLKKRGFFSIIVLRKSLVHVLLLRCRILDQSSVKLNKH